MLYQENAKRTRNRNRIISKLASIVLIASLMVTLMPDSLSGIFGFETHAQAAPGSVSTSDISGAEYTKDGGITWTPSSINTAVSQMATATDASLCQIRLLSNITTANYFIDLSSGTFTLDLNSYTVSSTDCYPYWCRGANVTVKNGSVHALRTSGIPWCFYIESGNITLDNLTMDIDTNSTATIGSPVYINNGSANVTINHCTLINNHTYLYQTGIDSRTSGTVNINNSEIILDHGCGIFNYGSNLTLNNTNITVSNGSSIPLQIYSGTVNIFNGSYTGPSFGIGYYGGTLSLSGAPTISGTTADIYLSSGSILNIIGTLTNSTPYKVALSGYSNGTAIASTSVDYSSNFTCANNNFAVVYKSETVQLFNYTANINLLKNSSGWSGQTVTLRPSADTSTIDYTVPNISGGTYRISNMTKTEYIYVNGIYTGKTVNSSSPVTVDAYSVSYYDQGSSSVVSYSGSTIPSEKAYYLDGQGLTLPSSPTRSGYRFDGWYTTYNGSVSATAINASESGAKAFYAKWIEKKIDIVTQPANKALTVGSISGNLNVAATDSEGGILTYTWYRCDDSSRTNPVSAGITGTTFTIPTNLTAGIYYYYCTVSSDSGVPNVNSNVATVAVHAHNYHSQITTQPTCTKEGLRTFTCSCGDSYTESIAAIGHKAGDWIVDTAATETTPGSRHKSCTVCGTVLQTETIPIVIKPTIAPTPTGIITNPIKKEGDLTITSKSSNGTPSISINNTPAQLQSLVLTPQEIAQIASGANIAVVLKVENADHTVAASDRALIQKALGNSSIAMYLDISLLKTINNIVSSAIPETNGNIEISFLVPPQYINIDPAIHRTYYIYRLHNNIVTRLNNISTKEDIIAFRTDKFSTYALGYQDTKADKLKNVPDTGDSSLPTKIYVISMILLAGLWVFSKKGSRKAKDGTI